MQRRRLTRLFSITPEVVLGLLGERRGRRYQQRIAPPNRRTGSSFFNLHPTNRRPDGPIGAALARLNHSTATNNNNNNNEGRKKKKEKNARVVCVAIVHQSRRVPPSSFDHILLQKTARPSPRMRIYMGDSFNHYVYTSLLAEHIFLLKAISR